MIRALPKEKKEYDSVIHIHRHELNPTEQELIQMTWKYGLSPEEMQKAINSAAEVFNNHYVKIGIEDEV